MSSDATFLEAAKMFGKGKIQVPKDVRQLLKITDEDKIVFYQDSEGKIFIEKAAKPVQKLGTY